MREKFVSLVRELQGTVRARRQEKIREAELSWSASELAAFRLFVMGMHASEMTDVCFALSDAQAIPLLEILADFAEKDQDLMKIAFQSMQKTPSLARIFLAKRLINSKKPEVRATTCEMLAASGPQAEALLEGALSDNDAEVRKAAIHAIARGDFKKLGPKLFPLLHGQSMEVRFSALAAIAAMGLSSPALSDDLLTILLDDSHEEKARRLAAGLLARAKNLRTRHILLDAMSNPGASYVLRVAAAESLCAYNDVDAIRAVLVAVDDRDANISKTARMSLGRRQSQEFATILEKLLTDRDIRIAELAAESLGSLDASVAGDIMMRELKTERRMRVLIALAQAMSKSGISGAWDALVERQKEKLFHSPAFFSALADVAEENNLPEFVSLFDNVHDAASRRMIMDRLALFAGTSPVPPQVESLALRALNESDRTLHLSAAAILAHVPDLNAGRVRLVLERLAAFADDPAAKFIALTLLRSKGGALTDVFLNAPQQASPILANAAEKATRMGDNGEQLFRNVAAWARNGASCTAEALRDMAILAPAALVAAMAKCPDQIFLIEAWSFLPARERAMNRPDFQAFFADARSDDALAGIRILKNLRDPRALKDMADVAFKSRDANVRQAALDFARELILAPEDVN